METKLKVKVAQSCPPLCDPMDYAVQGILQARIPGVGSLSLLQGMFPTLGSNPGLLHRRWILYQLSHKGSPKLEVAQSRQLFSPRNSLGQNTGVGSLSLLQGMFPTQELNPGLPYCR